jgi:hypothetical protein
LKRKFKIIEPIITPKIKLQDGDIELDQELQLYKTEIEVKYHKSSTNSFYRYPLAIAHPGTQFLKFNEEETSQDMKGMKIISHNTLLYILSQRRHF